MQFYLDNDEDMFDLANCDVCGNKEEMKRLLPKTNGEMICIACQTLEESLWLQRLEGHYE